MVTQSATHASRAGYLRIQVNYHFYSDPIVSKLAALFTSLILATSSAYAGNYEQSKNTIVDIAAGAGSFTTLVAALKAADLVDTLNGDGPLTVFAPTDEAFAALPEGALEGLLANPEDLANVLTLHVAPGKALASDVIGLASIETVQGQSLAIETTDGVTVGGAVVVQTDITASNGVIHVIDRVLLP